MARPRLLFVAPWFLFPANTGGRIRTGDILRGLKDGAFEITLMSPKPGGKGTYEAELKAVCDRFVGWEARPRGAFFRYGRLLGLASKLPVPVVTDRWEPARAAIDAELARGPDVAVIDFVHTAVLAPLRFHVPSVIFTHNVEAEIFRRHAGVSRNLIVNAVWRNQFHKMERFEREALGRFDRIVAVSEQDRVQFEQRYGLRNVTAIPTGVDLDYFSPASDNGTGRNGDTTVASIVFTGSMDWMPNIDGIRFFMDDVWPIIAARRPDASVTVVGREPPQSLVAAARQRNLPWTFTGFVDDVRPYVRASGVYVIPLRVGGGTRLKVFEAMAMGCPIVSTQIGVEGLPVEAGRHYLAADSAQDFAGAVAHLMDHPEEASRMAAEARAFVEANASSRIAARAFEEVCVRAARLDTTRPDTG